MSRITDPVGNVTTFGYDSRDRVTALSRSGATWRFDYSTPWQTKITDSNGKITTHHFDRRGRVNKVVDAHMSAAAPTTPTPTWRLEPGRIAGVATPTVAAVVGSPVRIAKRAVDTGRRRDGPRR